MCGTAPEYTERREEPPVYTDVPPRGAAQAGSPRGAAQAGSQRGAAKAGSQRAGTKEKGKKSGLVWFAVVVAGIIGAVVWSRMESEEVMRVVGKKWVSEVRLEALQVVREQGWDVPPGGVVVSSEVRPTGETVEVVRGAERRCATEHVTVTENEYVRTETTCRDDGTCTEIDVFEPRDKVVAREVCADALATGTQPVMATYYTFDIERWRRVDSAIASGVDTEPTWPAVDTNPRLRVTGRSRTFSLFLADADGAQHLYHPTPEAYPLYLPGMDLPVRRSYWGVTHVPVP